MPTAFDLIRSERTGEQNPELCKREGDTRARGGGSAGGTNEGKIRPQRMGMRTGDGQKGELCSLHLDGVRMLSSGHVLNVFNIWIS